MTSMRSFLMFYLPLLEPRAEMEDDEDFLEEDQEHPVDLVVPFKKSVKQIIREVRFILFFFIYGSVKCIHWNILTMYEIAMSDLLFSISDNAVQLVFQEPRV